MSGFIRLFLSVLSEAYSAKPMGWQQLKEDFESELTFVSLNMAPNVLMT